MESFVWLSLGLHTAGFLFFFADALFNLHQLLTVSHMAIEEAKDSCIQASSNVIFLILYGTLSLFGLFAFFDTSNNCKFRKSQSPRQL